MKIRFVSSLRKGLIPIPMIFLPSPSLHLEQLTAREQDITVLVNLTTEGGSCPHCQSYSSRVHSRYQRTLKDLPTSGVKWGEGRDHMHFC